MYRRLTPVSISGTLRALLLFRAFHLSCHHQEHQCCHNRRNCSLSEYQPLEFQILEKRRDSRLLGICSAEVGPRGILSQPTRNRARKRREHKRLKNISLDHQCDHPQDNNGHHNNNMARSSTACSMGLRGLSRACKASHRSTSRTCRRCHHRWCILPGDNHNTWCRHKSTTSLSSLCSLCSSHQRRNRKGGRHQSRKKHQCKSRYRMRKKDLPTLTPDELRKPNERSNCSNLNLKLKCSRSRPNPGLKHLARVFILHTRHPGIAYSGQII